MYGLMDVNTAMDREEVPVRTMNAFHRSGLVLYASLPCRPSDAITIQGRGTNGAETERHLVSALWNHLVAIESPLWKRCQSSSRVIFPFQVLRDPLGRPYLLLGRDRGPAISFSECGGNVWAALCGDESNIGIDVAGSDEFEGKYPSHRVFHPVELQHASSLAGGDLEKASALLWSVKEAVVKALGCAFHLVDPLQISIYPSEAGDAEGSAGYTFRVSLSGKALMRYPIAAGPSLLVHSIPQSNLWLSIALLNGEAGRQ